MIPHPDDQERALADALLFESQAMPLDAERPPDPPRIITNNRPLRDITAEIMEVLERTNDPPVLFVQGGRLVRLRQDDRGHAWLEPVNEYMLRRRVTHVADVMHASGDGEHHWHVFPSLSLMRDLLAMDTWPLPSLAGIIETPILRPDGSLLETPGYDATTHLLYRPPPGFTVPDLPVSPSRHDLATALALLEEPLEGFPFVDAAAKANALALLLTPILRHAITGPVPLALIDAPQAGTGKSLLAMVSALITTGRPAAMMTVPGGEEEWRKRITATLSTGTTFIILDNVEGVLTSSSLAAALTTEVWSDRLLGASAMLTLPQRATWLATGNNIRPGGDLPRRCYWIRLDAQTSRPWQRTDFRLPDLLSWVARHRRYYVAALLLVARAWYAAGQPQADTPTLGGFESWTRTIGGMLAHAGVPGFLSNLEAMYDHADDGSSQWEAFLHAWRQRYGDRALTVAELTEDLLHPDDPTLREALPDELADKLSTREGDAGRVSRRLGHAFRKRVEQRFGAEDLFLARAGDDTHRKVALWRVIHGREQRGYAGSPRSDSLPTIASQGTTRQQPVVIPPNPAKPHEAESTLPPAGEEEPADEEDPPSILRQSMSSPGSPVPYCLISDPRDLPHALAPLMHAPVLAVDTETTGLDPLTHHVRLLQLAIPGWPVMVLDLWHIPEDAREPLRRLLAGPVLKVFHNAKFDLQFLQQAGLPVQGPCFDTMLASQLLDAGLHSRHHSLADLVEHFLGEQLAKDEQSSDWSQDPLTPAQLAYAATDAAILLRLREALLPQLEQAGLMEVVQLECASLPAVAEMEWTGIGVDQQKLGALRQQLETETHQAAGRLRDLLQPMSATGQGTLFTTTEAVLNLDSPAQVLAALQALGIPVSNTRRGTLTPLAETSPVVRALLEYRRCSKALTFATSLPGHVHPHTGRIHAHYWQLGAATGRFSCSHPNLQQIPRTTAFRRGFIAPPGYRLVIADYSQIELRVMAELSRDPRMLAAYQAGEDLHTLTAALLLDKSMDQVTRGERQSAKAVNFGLIYAMGAEGLQSYAQHSYGVTLTLEEARSFRARFFAAYQGVAEWQQQIREAMPLTESRTLSGRRRQWAEPPRIAALYNTPVQGGAADIIKRALGLLPQALQGTGAILVGTIHDEILVEAPDDRAPEVAHLLKTTMEQAGQTYLSRVPVVADVRIASSWATS
jgi:DNA polymerase-1